MSGLAVIVAQGIPLAPPLSVRLIALVVVEAVLITTAVLLYVRWAQLKKEPLDEWWEGRKKAGFSARTRALMEEEENQRRAAEAAGAAPGHVGVGAIGVAESGMAEPEAGPQPRD